MRLAQDNLDEAEQRQVGLCCSPVLDYAAPKVIQSLEAKGISPFSDLQLNPDDYRLSHSSYSIYHWINQVYEAEIAFELGFQDTDVFYRGITPIMRKNVPLEYCEWLLAHGASITNMVPLIGQIHPSGDPVTLLQTCPKIAVAHYLMYIAGSAWCTPPYDEIRGTVIRLVNRIGSFQADHVCQCGCTDKEQGCSALSIFLRTVLSDLDGMMEILLQPSLIEELKNSAVQGSSFANITIRLLAFKILEIRHTCCDKILSYCLKTRGSPLRSVLESHIEDFPYIRAEDELLLEELEELVAEFQSQFYREEQSLSSFIESYLAKRMV
ncbi:uncharacterized protein F4817DRAFT_326280 [Daldinia loculata]|uniref:uncharacterized protein n=1 Tax=Daldinia loculata TaxID=103429 RepID=UPI0020C24ECC|nr:uncharacterized protein F4817DRAFT_326280 [Daldinia loculata]KAI1650945.1 hypothetical protein F4817DRAFT_326280 [Daldinia loculata]